MEKFVASGWDLIAVPAQQWIDKKALFLVEWLKDVIKELTIKCIHLMEQVRKLTAKINM